MELMSTTKHGRIDYLVGLVLVASPWVFDYASTDQHYIWIPFALGSFIVFYSLVTKYKFSLLPLISMKFHLALDVISGLFLAASPWIFRFDDVIYLPHLIIGLAFVFVALFTEKEYFAVKPVEYRSEEELTSAKTVNNDPELSEGSKGGRNRANP